MKEVVGVRVPLAIHIFIWDGWYEQAMWIYTE